MILLDHVIDLFACVCVSEGQFVKAGQPLFRIAIVGANEEIAKAKAAPLLPLYCHKND